MLKAHRQEITKPRHEPHDSLSLFCGASWLGVVCESYHWCVLFRTARAGLVLGAGARAPARQVQDKPSRKSSRRLLATKPGRSNDRTWPCEGVGVTRARVQGGCAELGMDIA